MCVSECRSGYPRFSAGGPGKAHQLESWRKEEKRVCHQSRYEDMRLINSTETQLRTVQLPGWPKDQQMIDNLEEVLLALPIPIADAVRQELATDRHGPLIE